MSEKTDKLWKKDDYLKPVNPNDPMLMYDIEEDEQGNLLKGNEKKSDNLQYVLFLTEEIQYHDGHRSRELGQAPILLCVPNS